MEFTDYSCPVCGERFKNGDDVVVCPECGAPHHRECYDKNGKCFYEDRHSQGFSFEKSEVGGDTEGAEQEFDVVLCPNCKAENERTAFYCKSCGMPLNERDRVEPDNGGRQTPPGGFNRGAGMPFGFGAAGMPAYDPLAGLKNDDELADGVTAGETAKYVGKNTQYYLTVFKNIKTADKSRFNFSAFLTSGAYFIYRKMTVPGIIISLLVIGLTVGSAYIMMSTNWMSHYSSLVNSMYNGEPANLTSSDYLWLLVPAIMSFLRLVIMIICGLTANRSYYRHCCEKIKEIKREENETDVNKVLEQRGGVNLPMAASFLAAIVVIYEICNFLLNTSIIGI